MQINKIIKKLSLLISAILLIFSACTHAQQALEQEQEPKVIKLAAERFTQYLPWLEDKQVAMVVNQTSMVKESHLVDTLLSKNINIKKVFAPEHGFRGDADAGEKIESGKDSRTGLEIISLYGDNKKPTQQQLSGIEVVVFDIQDVGTRFYTYISTMHYVMEACAEAGIPLVILDRPNPNGHYVDGPVLEMENKSFVGMHPIPIVHGLTVAELAQMINGEGWLADGKKCELLIVKTSNYHHDYQYRLPVKPSPNLPNDQSISLYPSLCFFEGTDISVGRGTAFPFQVAGYPDPKFGDFSFTPESVPGAKNPPYLGKECFGLDLRQASTEGFTLEYIIHFARLADKGESFFNSFFDKLAGTKALKKQIAQGLTEQEIRKTWEAGLTNYKNKRKNYLLYPDFTENKKVNDL